MSSTLGNPALRLWIRSLAAVLAVVGAAGAYLLARPDLVMVEHVVFVGAERSPEAALRHLSDVRNGTSMWMVDLDTVAAGVARHPWVRNATARRVWPDTVEVSVLEFVPVAMIELDRGEDMPAGLYYIASDGRVFLRAQSDDLDYPVLTGVTRALAASHPQLPGLVVRDALWLISELDRRSLVSRDEVSEVAFSRTRGFTLQVGTSELVFGVERLPQQVDRLAVLLGSELELSEALHIDLAPATVAIVRPRVLAAAGHPKQF